MSADKGGALNFTWKRSALDDAHKISAEDPLPYLLGWNIDLAQSQSGKLR